MKRGKFVYEVPTCRIIKGIFIDSQVGDSNKQILKNVGKIEKFLVDRINEKMDDILSFPSYYTVSLDE